jgi:hypothetical protein
MISIPARLSPLLPLAFLLTPLLTLSFLPAQSAELCWNQIDDDADGLVDCEDEDCLTVDFSGAGLGSGSSHAVKLADLDGDGDLDAWVASITDQPNFVWFNAGGQQGGVLGRFVDSGQRLGSAGSTDVALGDLDGDGDLDGWVANYAGPNRVWINAGGAQGGPQGSFVESGQQLGSADSRGVSLADLDGDGDLDAWVSNYGPNRVWINIGGAQGGVPGVFEDSGQALGSASSSHHALGDLDGDGDLDAWVVNFYGQSDRVWINAGGAQGGTPGSFVDSGQALGNTYSRMVGLGDLDGDGDLDAWIANTVGQANRIWWNAGGVQGGTEGVFVDSGQSLGNGSSEGVVLGDVDGDGDLDAYVSNRPDPNRVWLNSGGLQGGALGVFIESGNALGSAWSVKAALGDLDEDGDLDAWIANGDNTPDQVQLNDTGLFAVEGSSIGAAESKAVAVGDIDDDGDLDVCVANYTSPWRVYLNLGGAQGGLPGSFSDSGVEYANDASLGIALGDLDGDGDLDAWIANVGPDKVVLNQGGAQQGGLGAFLDSGQSLGNGDSRFVALGDLDGDGDLDSWVACTSGQPNRVWWNNGGSQGGAMGTFSDSGQALGASSSLKILLEDFDGDGDLDAWVVNCCYEANRLWLNAGGAQGGTPGVYFDSGQSLGAGANHGASAGDVDGDGDLDVLLSHDVGQSNRLWLNQGGLQGGVLGVFEDSGQALGGGNSYDVSLADLDADGDLDAWFANHFGQGDEIWLNGGGLQGGVEGVFEGPAVVIGADWSERVALADFDGDGDIDAWVAAEGPNTIRLSLNLCLSDADDDGIPNCCDVDNTGGTDCDGNGEDDTCQSDFDLDGVIDPCDEDLDGDGIENSCDLDQTLGADCDGNEIDDLCDLASGALQDCDESGIPDECEVSAGATVDCNSNGIPDSCDIAEGISFDCNLDGVPDECAGAPVFDCNSNGIPDACDLINGTSSDCDGNGILDDCDLENGLATDCDGNGALDSCDLASGAEDCDSNGVLDLCELDTDLDGLIDPCDPDLDGDGVENSCDIDQSPGVDCDGNGALDSCDIAGGAEDCDLDGVLDSCQQDTDQDGVIDACDLDLDGDGIENLCDVDQSPGSDCDGNGSLDDCDIAAGSPDSNENGIPDSCDGHFIRGDVNGDTGVNIADAISILDFLFGGVTVPCESSADSNDDGAINIADTIFLLGYLFTNAALPSFPFPSCGVDMTEDLLSCGGSPGC